MSKKILLLALAMGGFSWAFAQNDTASELNKFRVALGVDNFKTVDFLCSPNLYKSTRPTLQLAFTDQFKHGIFNTSLEVFMGAMKPNSGATKTVYLRETDIYNEETVKAYDLVLYQMGATMEASYLHHITKLSSPHYKIYFGGGLAEHLTFGAGLQSLGTINYASVNFKSRADVILNNGRAITVGYSFPLVSVVTRLPYHSAPAIPGKSSFETFFIDHNHVETVNRFQNLECTVSYPWIVRRKISLDIMGKVSWMHYYRPEDITRFGGQLALGLNF